MPSVEDFEISQGDDVVLNVDVDPDDGVTLAGATVRWWLARSKFSPVDKADLTKSSLSGQGIDIVDNEALTFSVSLSRLETLGLIGSYYHEAAVKDSQGKWVTVMTGTVTVNKTLIRES